METPYQPHATIARHGLAPDLLRGADQIAAYLFGSAGERRKVYHLAETSRLPVFRLGSLLCARRTTLLAWIEAQERGEGSDARPKSGIRPSAMGSSAPDGLLGPATNPVGLPSPP